MLKNDYAQAARELILAGKPADAVLRGLKQTLERHGHASILRPVLSAMLRDIERATTADVIEIRVAKEHDVKTYKSEIEAAEKTLGGNKATHIVIDESIVGGTIAKYKDKVIDASYKKQLLTIYRALTN